MTAVRKQIAIEEEEDAAQLKFPPEFKAADALLISEVHMLLKVGDVGLLI